MTFLLLSDLHSFFLQPSRLVLSVCLTAAAWFYLTVAPLPSDYSVAATAAATVPPAEFAW